jgi:ribosomal protein S18 acetylase RimI-like enzyme
LNEFLGLEVHLATLEDVSGIHKALLKNLIEVRDVNDLTQEERKNLEEQGFLRKEVKKEYYAKLIENPECDIYVAKDTENDIIGFASIHKNKFNIRKFRKTLRNLYTDDKKVKALLLDNDKFFGYLDQVSIIPEYQRKGVGAAIMKKIFKEIGMAIVSFIVKVPLANKASAYWHEKLGFKIEATCDGKYKGEDFEWWVYINWNLNKTN